MHKPNERISIPAHRIRVREATHHTSEIPSLGAGLAVAHFVRPISKRRQAVATSHPISSSLVISQEQLT